MHASSKRVGGRGLSGPRSQSFEFHSCLIRSKIVRWCRRQRPAEWNYFAVIFCFGNFWRTPLHSYGSLNHLCFLSQLSSEACSSSRPSLDSPPATPCPPPRKNYCLQFQFVSLSSGRTRLWTGTLTFLCYYFACLDSKQALATYSPPTPNWPPRVSTACRFLVIATSFGSFLASPRFVSRDRISALESSTSSLGFGTSLSKPEGAGLLTISPSLGKSRICSLIET